MKQYLVIIFLVLAPLAFGQGTEDSLSIELLKSMIFTLADDSMKGRASGSLEEQKTLDYLTITFKQLTGKTLKNQSFSFTKDSLNYQCKNAYYFKNNHSCKTILIGAHYDHIGFGGPLSLSFTSDEIHNGADDNASGVSLLLSLSQDILKQKDATVNYLIVFYSGHEIGLFGSSAFHQFIQSRNQFKEISAVINFDMVGRMDPTMKKLKCMRSPELDSLLQSIPMHPYSFKLNIADEEKLTILDTKTFVEYGIPCINFTTGLHNDYHKSSDDAKYINYQGLNEIRNFLLYFLEYYEVYLLFRLE